MSMVGALHMPVLLQEAIELLRVAKDETYVDGTIGLGGHTQAILTFLDGTGKVIGIDWDDETLQQAQNRLGSGISNLSFHHDNFRNLSLILNGQKISSVDGILLDLGVSSFQLESAERGFSFRLDGPLDMRLDRRCQITAADLLNKLSEKELTKMFWRYGQERHSRSIAQAIVRQRQANPLLTTCQLRQLVEGLTPAGYRGSIHPATRVFQALRINVNQELDGLEEFFIEAIYLLNPRGRIVVISFHSLEDRIVKTAFRKAAGRCICFRPGELCNCPRLELGQILTRKPVTPGKKEINENPRSRSAKLRAFEKCAEHIEH